MVQADETLSIAFSDLLPLLGNKMDKDHWHLAPAFERYKAIDQAGLGGLCEPEKLGLSPDHGRARLVVSSLTAEPGRGGRTEKNREYIFVWPETEDRPIQNSCVTIDTRVAERFLGSLNRDSNAKKDSDTARNPETLYDVLVAEGRATCFEQPEIPEGEQTDRRKSLIEQLKDPNKWGLPVYWRNPETGGNQQYCSATPILSLTPFLRVPYKYSVQDMVQRTQPFPTPGTPEDDTYDLVQALLGWAPLEPPKTRLASRTKQEKALRSRVRFGFAMSGNAQMTAPKSYAATRPRASYWPFYLKPNGDNKARHPFDFNNEQAILSGRKRYVARGGTDSLPQVSDQGSASAEGRDERMNSAVTFLKEGALFSGEIRFRSISAIELGALVWAITFGDLEGKHGYRHMMGRAKAFGYGQVRARISGSGDLDLQGALNAFTDWVSLQMDQPFETLPQIRSLRAMASPEIGKQQAHLLKYPEHGSGGSSAERVLAGYQELKTKATNTRGQYGGKTIQETSALGLPEYPDIGQTGTSKT
ncbi:MAG: hypothetical protein BM559_01550 [Roseobacter sp. MedPE-SWchi]|nr:MAG: hypothetical protein BM559_01550 [Roseobacter sp. MedPE-SWchi]